MTTIQDRFRLRRGTAANLAAVNEVPLDSEIVIESDTGTADGARKFKVGDGATSWNDLPYFTLVDTVIRCRLATAAALPANTYANGSSGAGATLTMTTAGVLTVDGVATGLGDVLLVANEAAAANNGVYQVTTAGAVGVAAVLTRFARFVAPTAIPGRLLTVGPLGTANANTAWQSTTAAAPTVGTTSITFARVGGLGGSQFAVAGGTADALTATFGILPALVDGLQFSVRAASANATTVPTFNPNSLGALTICKLGGGALRAGDIAGAGHELILRYRASPARYELLNPKGLASVMPGSNVTVDTTDPFNPVVASTAAGIGLKGRLAAYANLPSSGNTAGDAYVLDSDSLVYVWNGIAWPSSGSGLSMAGNGSPHIVPKVADFTSLGASLAITAADKVGRMVVSIPSATTRPRCLLQTLPAAPYTIDVGGSIVGFDQPAGDACAFSIGLSNGTAIYTYAFAVFGGSVKLSCDRWTNTTTYNATSFTKDCSWLRQFSTVYLRLTDDGTSRKFYFSINGLDYYLLFTEGRTVFFTATQGGLEFYNLSNTGAVALAQITHFKITNSVLGDAP